MQKGFAPILILVIFGVLAAGGYLFYQNQYKKAPSPESEMPILDAYNQKPTSTDSAQPTPDTSSLDTSNWKTYTNKKYGISFKYPTEANVNEGKAYSMLSTEVSDAVTVDVSYKNVNSEGYIIDIVVRDNPNNQSPKVVIDNYISKVEKDCSPPACSLPQKVRSSLKEYNYGDINGYTFHFGAETDSVMVVANKNNKTYVFRTSNGNGYATEEGIKVLDQILSTFKFTN